MEAVELAGVGHYVEGEIEGAAPDISDFGVAQLRIDGKHAAAEDFSAAANGAAGFGEEGGASAPADKWARIQAGASSVTQSAVINSGANFGLELVFGDDALFMIKMARGFVSAAAEIVEMFWFASHFEMAAAREIAGDIFFAN